MVIKINDADLYLLKFKDVCTILSYKKKVYVL